MFRRSGGMNRADRAACNCSLESLNHRRGMKLSEPSAPLRWVTRSSKARSRFRTARSASWLCLHAASAGRFEPANRFAGEVLEQAGLATLQVDLLTPSEESSAPPRQASEPRRATDAHSDAWSPRLAPKSAQHEQARLRPLCFDDRDSRCSKRRRTLRRRGGGSFAGWLPRLLRRDADSTARPTLLIVGQKELARAPELAAEFFARHLR